MGCELDFLVPPLRSSVLTRNQAHAMDTTEVSIDERIPVLGVVFGAVGEPEMPFGVFIPGVRLQEGVLVGGTGLDIAPIAVEYVVAGIDESSRSCYGMLVIASFCTTVVDVTRPSCWFGRSSS